MSNAIADSLDPVIEKYRRIPDGRFLLYEAYRDKSDGTAVIVFEVRNYSRSMADEADITPLDASPGKESVSCAGQTTFTSQMRPGKKYAVVSGLDVADRAMRIKQLLQSGVAHPPGTLRNEQTHVALETVGPPHVSARIEPAENIACPAEKECPFRGNCPGNRKTKLTAARQDGIAAQDIRCLQRALFKFGYGDEMFFERYGEDGRYGPRTKLAVSHFVKELNELDGAALAAANGANITREAAEQIVRRCRSGWTRNHYYRLKDSSWDLAFTKNTGELGLLAVRFHVRQLQEDLAYFAITRPQSNDPLQPYPKPLESLWKSGHFDSWTRNAVIQFQTCAARGYRYDPLQDGLLRGSCVTFTGQINGVVDGRTKEEIERWHIVARSLSLSPEVAVTDSGSWTVDLKETEIISPALGCAALTKPGRAIRVLVGIRKQFDGAEVSPEQIKANLPYFLFLLKPSNSRKPFRGKRKMYPEYDLSYTVQNVSELTDAEKQQLYKGTAELDYQGVIVDRSLENMWRVGMDDAHNDLYKNDFGYVAHRPTFEKLIDNCRKAYVRKYKGLLESLADQGKKAWAVTLFLGESIEPGMYDLSIRGSRDIRPHPVRVFAADKTEYSIAHLTDIHAAKRYDELPAYLNGGDNYNNPNERLRDFFRRHSSADIDMVIITGDAIDYANNHRPYEMRNVDRTHIRSTAELDRNWELLYTIITQNPGTDIPVYITLGNHEFKHNPASVQYMLDDLNITERQAESYRMDTQDTHTVREVVLNWWLRKSFGDTLFADMNAAQFYFRNICPFVNFAFSIDALNIIIMNTGPDRKIFIDQYTIRDDFDETWEFVKGVLSHDNPAPNSAGIAAPDLGWLKNTLDDSGGKTNVLCMHNQLFNPHFPFVNLMENRYPWNKDGPILTDYAGWGCADFLETQGWYTQEIMQSLRALAGDPPRSWVPTSADDFGYIELKLKTLRPLLRLFDDYAHDQDERLFKYRLSRLEKEIQVPPAHMPSDAYAASILRDQIKPGAVNLERLWELKDRNYGTSGIDQGTAELRSFVESGRIPFVLTGHIHTDMEARCERRADRAKWYYGAYSWKSDAPGLFADGRNALVLSTVSGGVVGYHYVASTRLRSDLTMDDASYSKLYAVAGYRVITIEKAGKPLSFKTRVLYSARDHKRPSQ